MGDEFDVGGCLVFANGETFPLGSLNDVEFEADDATADAVAPFESLSGTFSMTAEAFSGLVNDIARADLAVRSFVVELDSSVRKSFPGPSRFMRSRRIWQCRRGRRNANVERRKLSRKRRHTARCKRRLVFPGSIITKDVEANVFKFEVYGGTCLQEVRP